MSIEIEQKLIELISAYPDVKASEITPETLVVETGIDSLDIAELIFDIEEHYDIELKDADALSERFKPGTIRELSERLAEALAMKS